MRFSPPQIHGAGSPLLTYIYLQVTLYLGCGHGTQRRRRRPGGILWGTVEAGAGTAQNYAGRYLSATKIGPASWRPRGGRTSTSFPAASSTRGLSAPTPAIWDSTKTKPLLISSPRTGVPEGPRKTPVLDWRIGPAKPSQAEERKTEVSLGDVRGRLLVWPSVFGLGFSHSREKSTAQQRSAVGANRRHPGPATPPEATEPETAKAPRRKPPAQAHAASAAPEPTADSAAAGVPDLPPARRDNAGRIPGVGEGARGFVGARSPRTESKSCRTRWRLRRKSQSRPATRS